MTNHPDEAPRGTLLTDARAFVASLLDAGMDVGLTRSMIATIYRVGWLVAAVPPVVGGVMLARQADGWSDVAWIVVAVALYLVLVTALRLALGIGLLAIRLMEQLMMLPAAVDSLTSQVEQLRGDVSGLGGHVELLRGDVGLLGGHVEQLRDDVVGLTGQVQVLPPAVGDLTHRVDSLHSSLESAQFWRVARYMRRFTGGSNEG